MSETRKEPVRAFVVFGTRPEAVKLLELIRSLRADGRFAPRVVVTGQHREMLDEILVPFGIVPDADLCIMKPGQTLNEIVARSIPKLDEVYAQERPDIVLVQGDTTSAFCAALAAFHRRIPVGHVEAGLRTFDRFQPYPEECNRRMISAICDLHFAPTRRSADNILHEGVPREAVVVTGNTVIDALLLTLAETRPPDLAAMGLSRAASGPLVLITLHRRESFETPAGPASLGSPSGPPGSPPATAASAAPAPATSVLEGVFWGIRRAAEDHPDATFVYPVHLNPKVREPAQRVLGGLSNVVLAPPMPYVPFVHLMARAALILTDSGGIQEEAPSLGVPVLVLRERTERPEGLEAGTNRLVGTSPERIREEVARELRQAAARPLGAGRPGLKVPRRNPFGDGRAHERIRQAILHFFRAGPPADEFRADAASAAPPPHQQETCE